MALSHIGRCGWVSTTLRVGPLLCPDNVGILIFERYFLKFFRLQLFLSFFNFLGHLVLSQKYLYVDFVDLHSCPLSQVKEREVSGLSARSNLGSHFGLRFLNIPKSWYFPNIVNFWAISWGIATGLVANVQCSHPHMIGTITHAPFSTLILLVTRLSEARRLGHASLYRNGRGQED